MPGLAVARNTEVAQAEAPKLPHVKWWKEPHLRKLYAIAAVIILTSATTGYDGSMLNNLQLTKTWNQFFGKPSGSILGFYNCVMGIGAFCGLPFAPWFNDHLGRRWSIAIGGCIMLVGVALQTAANGFQMFVAGRFFIGFGCNIAQASAPLLLTELCHPQHRAPVTAIYNTTWNLGAILACWITFGTFRIQSNWAWRLPSLFQGAPTLIQLCLLFWVPESPRWLINKERHEEALAVLAKYHGGGNPMDPTVQFEYQEILQTIELEKTIRGKSYLEFFRTKGNRHRLLILVTAGLFSQWSGNGLFSYYQNIVFEQIGFTGETRKIAMQGGITIFSYCLAIFFALTCNYFGRRPLFITSTASMCAVFTILTICGAQYTNTGSRGAAVAFMVFLWLYNIAYNIAWCALLVAYSVEILPYDIRAKGLTIMNISVQLALIFNQYVNPIGLGHLGWKYYIFYCVWIAVETVIVFFAYPETKYIILEEIPKIFDGDQAAAAQIHVKGVEGITAAAIHDSDNEIRDEKVSHVNETVEEQHARKRNEEVREVE